MQTCYDSDGTYGHPDHIQVHRVGVRAAELAGVGLVYEATVNRDHVMTLVEAAADLDLGDDDPFDDEDGGRPDNLGVDGVRITHQIDVSSVIDRKRRAMAVHASQITEDSFFMKLTGDLFTMAFGVEWFIERGATPGTLGSDLFESLRS